MSRPPKATTLAETIKTPRHFDANRPFGATPMTKQAAKLTDPSTLTICNDALPVGRASPGFKYAPLFSAMKVGQCVKCQPDEVGRIAGALKKWIEMQGGRGMVRSSKDYGDGQGRVWWLEGAIQKRVKLRAAA